MGCDIHIHIEVRDADEKWQYAEIPPAIAQRFSDTYGSGTYFPFETRSYSVFGFLANVRNYANCPCISEPKGLPDDSIYLNEQSEDESIHPARFVSRKDSLEDDGNYHSFSYLTLDELLYCDYDITFENLRRSGASRSPTSVRYSAGSPRLGPGQGEIITVREHLGEDFFEQVEALRTFGKPEDVRIVFFFDN